ncbi:hypothetical protein BB560_002186 [Smittium megazygosporum]|uniref:peptide-methionine (S)-S-oxide reductase n=1 Tax=Smittium megazygosporum TaxID=133381 RepID=A0A2T9ZFI8_9FUNG|nr:hypothetical protein BB560_002186 [Smittium megazygosporum]
MEKPILKVEYGGKLDKLPFDLYKDLTFPEPISKSGRETTELATLAAGCFGPPDLVYRRTAGVLQSQVGYIGGNDDSPTYEKVCLGNTGHVEAVRIEYDTKVISFGDILKLYFMIFDPTRVQSKTCGAGPQYRPVIFFHSQEHTLCFPRILK